MKRREKGAGRRIFAGILAAALLTGSVGAQNISAAQHIGEAIYQEETDRQTSSGARGDGQAACGEAAQITEFAKLTEKQAAIGIPKKGSLKELLAKLPETLKVSLKGQKEPVFIPVTWVCAGDYENSTYYYYQFNPQWDTDRYPLGEGAKIPYIGVFVGRDFSLRLGTMSENRDTIYRFMREEMGFNMAAACGVVANVQSESSFNPTASMIDTNGLISFGLCQWNGPRYEALQKYCKEYGYDYKTVKGQLRYLKYELETSEASACRMVKNVPDTAAGAYQAGYNWARYFERCSSVYYESRANLAKNTYWPLYSGKEPDDDKDDDEEEGSNTSREYSIHYYLDGGENHEDNPNSYSSTDDTITLENPVKAGYKFGGWYKNKAMTKKVTTIPAGSTGNMKLYAKWIPISYTIRFDGNQATSGAMAEMKDCEYDESYTLRANKFKKTGCKFAGWNTKADGRGKAYANKEDFENLTKKDGKIITLYAQWKKQTYTITYRLKGGIMEDDNPEEYNVSTPTFTLNPPVRAGYTFEGWYRESSYKTKVTKIEKGTTGNLTLYAKWRVNQYKIVYNGNGATGGSMPNATVCKYGKNYTLAANKFEKKGYIFNGWNTKANGSGKEYKNKAKVKNLSTKNNKTITLYAQWSKKEYTIAYELNGGVMVEDNPTSYYDNTKTFTLKAPEREGYTFLGWYTDEDFTTKITKIKKGSKKNYTLYARWRANEYAIQFDGNGATGGAMQAMEGCLYDSTYTLPANGFVNNGRTFAGWNTAADGSDVFYGDGAAVENLTAEDGESVTLYAQWQ